MIEFPSRAPGESSKLQSRVTGYLMKRHFREVGVDTFAYANETVRVRGWVERIGRRPEIEIATPSQVEIVDTPQSHATTAQPG